MIRFLTTVAFLCFVFSGTPAARAQNAPSPYAAFIAGARAEHGLFTVWHKNGKVYLEIAKSQLDHDFMETITTANGTGVGLEWGDNDYLPSEIVRFEEHGNQIAIVWPNWYAQSRGNPQAQLAIEGNLPNSVVGIGDIAESDGDRVIFDLSSLMEDQLDLHNFINDGLPKGTAYNLDPKLSYFDSDKAFPDNVIVTVGQSWITDAEHVIDTAPDARRILIKVVYNFTQLPQDDYRPRLSDDRVGIYNDIYFDFSTEHVKERQLRYLVRWNFDPADPSHPSPARHPMVIYLSNSIPLQYRDAIRDACLEWNKAYARIGILNAVQVRAQPDDPNWDPDDVRYNVIRWLTEFKSSFGADSNTLFDPRTGEEIRVGVLVSGEEGRRTDLTWRYLVDPVRNGRSTDPTPASFMHDSIFATLLHEMGHNMGLQHNFIGSQAYTANDLQSPAFTAKYGITTTAMEYAPINLWPRPYSQGTYFQTTIGPYDYYAIKYGYANVPGAQTPEQELPTLRRWASGWSNPLYSYASDEDVSWADGHASDPRSEQGDLTNDSLRWCTVQIAMYHNLAASLNRLEPHSGDEYNDETYGFARALGSMLNCATLPAHWVGGQYVSRAHSGDPHAAAPIVPVSRVDEQRAFAMLDRYLFSDRAWNFAPSLLDRLGYSEWAGYGYVSWPGYGNLPDWAYDPPARHDFPVVKTINDAQLRTINFFFQPLVLQRIDENPMLSTTRTMTIADLFQWMQRSVYGDLNSHSASTVRRNLQSAYVTKLIEIANDPEKGTPGDAQAMARLELQDLAHQAALAAKNRSFDTLARAHAEDLARRAVSAIKP
ncbi:MAG: zinc-dependent metalloprotease [Candidatus Eremiobacteraeota bacterium]|nr:zinc-dependent metalloprotease [Candidatus Eremiobacteraeota bacterium]